MKVNVADRIIVRGHQAGDPNREAVIVEVYGADGRPPYVVRWSDGHEGLFFPGSDANVEPAGHAWPVS
jgi:hypothetical protein